MTGTASTPSSPGQRSAPSRLPPSPAPSPTPEADCDEAASCASIPSSALRPDADGPHDSFYLVPSPGIAASFVLPAPMSASEPETPSELAAPSEPGCSLSASDASSSLLLSSALPEHYARTWYTCSRTRAGFCSGSSSSSSPSISPSPPGSPPTWADASFATHSWVEQAGVLFPHHHGGVFESSSTMLVAQGPTQHREENAGDDTGGNDAPPNVEDHVARQREQDKGRLASSEPSVAALDCVTAKPPQLDARSARPAPCTCCAASRTGHMCSLIARVSTLVALTGVLATLLLTLGSGLFAPQPRPVADAWSASASAVQKLDDSHRKMLVNASLADLAPAFSPLPALSRASPRALALATAQARYEKDASCAPDSMSSVEQHLWLLPLSSHLRTQGGRAVTRAARGASYVVCRTKAYYAGWSSWQQRW